VRTSAFLMAAGFGPPVHWLRDQLDAGTRTAVRNDWRPRRNSAQDDGNYWRLLSNHCLIETSLGAAGRSRDSEAAVQFVRKARSGPNLSSSMLLGRRVVEGVVLGIRPSTLRYLEALRTSALRSLTATVAEDRILSHLLLASRPSRVREFQRLL
jgi:hypothetical protein